MQHNFARAIDFVLHEEGGFSDDPNDRGGATNFGISQTAYPNWDIKNLTKEQAIGIYQVDYWDAISGNKIAPGVDLMTFDCAVNQGTRAAARLLQEACHVKVDGVIGPITLRATYDKGVLPKMAARRALRYIGHPQFNRYGPGWIDRLMRCMASACLWQTEK